MPRRLRRFMRTERASATIEFVVAFPVVFLMFLVVLELAFLMARSTLLQQALDVTMREVRLGVVVNPTVSSLEQRVCSRMTTSADCERSLVLEFTTVDQATFAMPGPRAPCTRRSAAIMADRADETYNTGAENELMVVRACMVANTITPVLDDAFQLFARSAFVNEPRD